MGRFDTGQSLVKSLRLVAELLVVKTEQMQDRRMEIVDVDRVFHNIIAEIVSFPINLATTTTSPRHPHRETAWMMVAAVVFFGQPPLRINCPAKLTTPNDQRLIEQTPLLQILNQSITGLIDVTTLAGKPASHIRVRIPIVEIDLHKADTPFH